MFEVAAIIAVFCILVVDVFLAVLLWSSRKLTRQSRVAQIAEYDEQVKALLRLKSAGALYAQQRGLQRDKTPQAVYMTRMVSQVIAEKTYIP
jgi:hypothetical protein